MRVCDKGSPMKASTPKTDWIALPVVPVNENTERIFHEAWLMFQELGYRGASIDELCQRCNLTKPTLYHYFGNKERLFIQVMLRQLQGYRAILQSTEALAARLEALAAAMLASFSTDISSMMHDMAHIHDPALHRIINQAFRRELMDPLIAVMQTGMAAGQLRTDEPEFFAWIFLGLVNTFIRTKSGATQTVTPPVDLLARRLVAFFLVGAENSQDRKE